MTASITSTNGATVARPLAIPYKTASGEKRQALIGVDAAGAWSVYDTPAVRTGRIVARLDGAGEEARHAAALAAEYVKQQLAYAKGESLEDPLPKAEEKPLAAIVADAQRASITAAEGPAAEELPEWFLEIVVPIAQAQLKRTKNPQAPSTSRQSREVRS